MSKPLTQEQYLERAIRLHGDVYDYSECVYRNQKKPVKISCKIHGPFMMAAGAHTDQKQGCPKCGRESARILRMYTQEEFVQRAVLRHEDKYDYSKAQYKNCEQHVEIVCKDHGSFFQIPTSHILGGRGCPKCAIERRHGFTRERFVRHCGIKKTDAKIYMIEIFNEEERFLKVGITSTSMTDRFGYFKYQFKELFGMNGSAEFIWDLEKNIHRLCQPYRYEPRKHFKGHTECYSLSFFNEIKDIWSRECASFGITPKSELVKEKG